MKKVCVVTGTRAEYGLLKPIIDKIHKAQDLELQLVATGMHLSPEFGLTYRVIEADGYTVTEKVEMLLSSDTSVGVTKSMAVALMGFGECFDRLKPDMLIILGDRYEMLAVASAALVARIPIAHIHGGETTEGAIDEAIRHSITKMSHLHFTSTETYRRRVIQLGENPHTVYNVGALGVENVKNITLMKKEELETSLGIEFDNHTVMLTYHPVTLENMTAEGQFRTILDVLDAHKEIKVIFTKANSDTDGRIINLMIDDYVSRNSERCRAFTSLGQLRYLSCLKYCTAVVGNSSSGLIEVPSFGIPTINIGDRQKGRICADSVINCGNNFAEIEAAFLRVCDAQFRTRIKNVNNPYEGINTSGRILEVVNEYLSQECDMKKRFYDMN